ncbi:o-succinylbenzoate synthase [Sporosarcina sp. Marseille-Q4063]|uniref:o-succinylbenzoate synthase n=1 Tax=Sporosarcina sp. Marseille-Q4063 TaxID=2810514 RepID=UPI001BAFEE33|nr:o-succinylbenzoate synthase [Sporosarcina sp. Marseille-Q4063]QUW23216.1 o-succinylbenzoate synthase [Sporosarcina sp. Marseille-Q4063]
MGKFTITEIRLYRVSVPLKTHFSTHLQTVTNRESIFVEMVDSDGEIGLGECVAFSSPWYTEETVQTCWDALVNWLIPALVDKEFAHPSEVSAEFSHVKGNRMAKACLDQASWDLFAIKKGLPLWKLLGGVRREIDAGVVLTGGIDDRMVSAVRAARDAGYKRVKLKFDVDTKPLKLKNLVDSTEDMLFFGDANGIFDKLGLDALKKFDQAGLALIEQPFGDDEWRMHWKAVQCMKTPIALDESIRSVQDVKRMATSGAGSVVVLKPGRIGGTTESLKVLEVANANGLDLWIGGMIEFGISKAHNLALASLPQFSLPGDFSASDHFWHEDPVEPTVVIENGVINLSERPGIGVKLNKELVEKYLIDSY